MWQVASSGHFINGKKLSPVGHLGNSAAVQGSCQLSWQHLYQKTELTLHEVCNLSFSPTGPDVFESRARRQKEKKKKCLVPSANTYPNQHDTWQEQVSLECSVNPCSWSQLATLFPPLPQLGSAQGWEVPCRRQRGHKHCHSRFPGLLRTERGNNDSALSKQLPAVLKLLQT